MHPFTYGKNLKSNTKWHNHFRFYVFEYEIYEIAANAADSYFALAKVRTMVRNVGNDIRNPSSRASTYETKVEMDAAKTTKSSQRVRIRGTHNRTQSYTLVHART